MIKLARSSVHLLSYIRSVQITPFINTIRIVLFKWLGWIVSFHIPYIQHVLSFICFFYRNNQRCDVGTLNTFIILFTGPCEVETGQSSIIVDIEESRGSRKFKAFFLYSENLSIDRVRTTKESIF